MVIDECVADIGEWQSLQRGHGIVGTQRTATHSFEQLTNVGLVHGMHAATA
jgi:hypothetical protein